MIVRNVSFGIEESVGPVLGPVILAVFDLDSSASLPGLTPQVGYTRLEAFYSIADLGQARGPRQSITLTKKAFFDGCAGQARA